MLREIKTEADDAVHRRWEYEPVGEADGKAGDETELARWGLMALLKGTSLRGVRVARRAVGM